MPLNNRQFARQVYGRVTIDISESIIDSGDVILDLVHPYYKEIKNMTSNVENDKINVAINELNYEDIEENFKLIDDPFKASVFIV